MKSFIMRGISLFIGIMSLYLLFTHPQAPSMLELTLSVVMAAVLIVYGIGGLKWLAKVPVLGFFATPIPLSFKEKHLR